jgi:hypothetical protein
MEIVCASDRPKFTVSNVRIQVIRFERTAKEIGSPVTLAAEGFSLCTFTGTHSIAFDNPEGTRHEDLLPLWNGTYEVEGLIPGDLFVVTYKPAILKPESLHLSERDTARMHDEWQRERGRKAVERAIKTQAWGVRSLET